MTLVRESPIRLAFRPNPLVDLYWLFVMGINVVGITFLFATGRASEWCALILAGLSTLLSGFGKIFEQHRYVFDLGSHNLIQANIYGTKSIPLDSIQKITYGREKEIAFGVEIGRMHVLKIVTAKGERVLSRTFFAFPDTYKKFALALSEFIGRPCEALPAEQNVPERCSK